MRMPSRQQASQIARGFTILEVMVTIGILVLIAAGVSSIFSSVAETVNRGRRVAELNRYAAQFERVMRVDFENMTRDGFLIIAHQTAPGINPSSGQHDVQLTPSDASDPDQNGRPGRSRRVDEIMFFSRGQYETSRRAISPGMIAKSTEAAIYYGHGQKRRPDFDASLNTSLNSHQSNLFFNPFVNDNNIRGNASGGQNQAGLGTPSTDGGFNPNQYASDWALLRQVTLLANPQSSGQELPDQLFGIERINADRQWLEDSDRQVALQPASRSIFNSLTESGYSTPTTGYVLPKWFGDRNIGGAVNASRADPSLRASGLVDIATDDLASIRTILYGLSGSSDTSMDDPTDYWSRSNPQQIQDPMDLSYEDFAEAFWEDTITSPNPTDARNVVLPVSGTITPEYLNVRKWMLDAMPSLWDVGPTEPIQLSRVRYEDIPTRLLYAEDEFDDSDNGDRLKTYAEANQEMLGSSVFIPQCTEFIVEWSFGYIDATITDPFHPRYKKLRWHGLERWIDANNDGIIDDSGSGFDEGEDQKVADYYNLRPNQPAIPDFDRGPRPELIVGHIATVGGFGPPPTTEIAAFGYPDASGNDWPWPKFVRVTISIADPLDNTIEETFQMVFDIPEASNN
jgi:prepilin-type N-terminal cleavage/methylation domain-containing protein|tara:strand:- start:44857 stop:46734 length:1878 start_codon:yes stop_codon:yes gene_type:complete